MILSPTSNEQEKVAIDARLLSDAIIELNIARRNVAIYPKNHPSVDRSLNRAFEFLYRIFDLRPEITLAVAKDTLIIDDYYLDKKNPVYSEFALQLSRLNIAYVTFITGITKEEIYTFHSFIAEKRDDMPVELIQESFQGLDIIHIKAGFIDYDAFAFEEDKIKRETAQMQLWERYVFGLIEGTLQTGIVPEEFKEIPPDVLARFINRAATQDEKVQAYDKIITSYIRRAADRTFSSKDLRRLLDFINGLKPELKKQFLSTTARHFSEDMDSTYRSLKNVSVDEVIELLGTINEQQVFIPDSLKNLLDKLSDLSPQGINVNSLGDSLLIDDIFLSPDIMNLLGKKDDETFITERYRKDIQELLSCDISKLKIANMNLKDIAKDYTDEALETKFNQTLLELIVTDIVSEEEFVLFADMIKDHIKQYIWTGQYQQILKIIQVTTSHVRQNRFPHITVEMLTQFHSQEFMTDLIESFRLLGRQMREESWILCEYYGKQIIPYLMDALVKEESQVVRKYLIGLIKRFDDKVIPEVLKRLGDSRWFVKRNMLYILGELKREEVIPYVRPYCRHENPKVSIEAIRCLLSLGDAYGINAVRELLSSESRDYALQAVMLSGMFRLNKVVPDLINLLKKRGFNGSDVFVKIPIVKALGDIGDPWALDGLRSLLRSKSILFKGTIEKLREEIYRTLKYYPLDTIYDFVSAGMQSQNTYIREESNRLYKLLAH
jgi:HEAT repeat protein